MDYSGDDFFIDDLLDLSNADDIADENNKPCSLSPPHNKEEEALLTNNSPVKQDFIADPFLQGPDFDNLEWLSHFVEDSFSDYSLTYSPEKHTSCFTGPVQTKAGPPSMSLTSSSSSVAARKPPKKKKKMEKRAGIGAKQCSHCGVQKTPLWRTGPLGEKTLCNACGVRFKSGRLLPEYRPASSPTFSTGLHSNSHRKVLEMRQKKETESGRPVQSF